VYGLLPDLEVWEVLECCGAALQARPMLSSLHARLREGIREFAACVVFDETWSDIFGREPLDPFRDGGPIIPPDCISEELAGRLLLLFVADDVDGVKTLCADCGISFTAQIGWDVARRFMYNPGWRIPLIDATAGTGALHCYRFLSVFGQVPVTTDTFALAVASGNDELVRIIRDAVWPLSDEQVAQAAGVAAAAHRPTFGWLARQLDVAALGEISANAVLWRNVPAILELVQMGVKMQMIPATADWARLAACGIDKDARDREGWGPLHFAGRADMVAHLIEKGCDPNCRDAKGSTALHWASNSQVVRALLAAGADANATDGAGATPLHRAYEFPVLRELLLAGADAEARNSANATPLCVACHPVCVAMLIGCAEVDVTKTSGFTKLMEEIDPGQILMLCGAGANVDAGDGEALSDALSVGAEFRARVLLWCGADPNLSGLYGLPLILALRRGASTSVFRSLLAAGADVRAERSGGASALELSATEASDAVRELLEQAARPSRA
jgi:hypothetical protein